MLPANASILERPVMLPGPALPRPLPRLARNLARNLALAAGLALAACGDEPGTANRGTSTTPGSGAASAAVSAAVVGQDPEVQSVVILEKIANLMLVHQASCPNMGAALSKFVQENRTVITQVKIAQKAQTDAVRTQRRKAVEARLRTVMEKVMAHGMKCKDDAQVRAAMQQI